MGEDGVEGLKSSKGEMGAGRARMPAIGRAESAPYLASSGNGRELNEFERGCGRFTATRPGHGGFVDRLSFPEPATSNERTMNEER